jgi:molecular chaperone Hsp33
MINYDTLQRFLFTNGQVRGEIVRMRASYQAILERHPYPLPIRKLLGQALASVALISATLKFKGSLILQIENGGPVKVLVAQSDHEFHVRGLAQWEEDKVALEMLDCGFEEGRLALTLIPEKGERYQGIVMLQGRNIGWALEVYFRDSEQLSTVFFVCADEETVAGMLLQVLPHEIKTEQAENFWEHIRHLARTLTEEEFLTLDNEQILHRLFHEETIQLFDPEPVAFRCSCSIDRMERALLLMSHEEIQELLQAYKKVDVRCEFCNNQYTFDAVDINRILTDGKTVVSDSTTRH